MITLDTNVLVRVLVGDDPVQTPVAEQAFLEGCRSGGVFVPLVVLAELGWVLRAGYGLDRPVIHARLERLVRTRGVHLQTPTAVLAALDAYADGEADLADYLVLGAAREHAAKPVRTFDRALGRHADVELLGA